MGKVVNETRALLSVCTCYQVGETKYPEDLMCYSDGIIGTLSNRQDRNYCPDKDIRPPTPEMLRHQDSFTKAVKEAQRRYRGGEPDFIKLIDEELEKEE